jgi:predicted ATP-dependent protease
VPDDWVYVNNFLQPGRPRAINLPPGMGLQFREDMERFNGELVKRIPRAFETDQYADARDQREQELRALQQREISVVDRACQEQGFALVRSPSGIYIAPVREGEVLTPEDFSQLPQEERERLDEIFSALQDQLDTALRRIREHERVIQEAIESLDQEVADFTIQPLIAELKEKYIAQLEALEYLEEMRKDIILHVGDFRGEGELPPEDDGPGSLLDVPPSLRYRVNLLVDHSQTQGAPVVVEDNPTYDNLIGRIEYDVRYGSTVTDYTLIRSGALHRANGGYLILRAETLFEAPYAWAGLKRALASGMVSIERPDSQQLVSTITPEPEPIPLRLKVILLGSPLTYYTIYGYDDDFAELFKVRGDFEVDMMRTVETEQLYARFIRATCEREKLLHFSVEAVAQVVEFGSRFVEDRNRLSTCFGAITDLLRESSYWAVRSAHGMVQAADVKKALMQRVKRASQDAEDVLRSILEGVLIVETTGTAVGQINGLTVIQTGEYDYGLPARITARAYAGRGDVVDIQREIHLSGPIHGKGVLTLLGYLGGQYCLRRPLSMEASISFEQVYSEIEGDSASVAELFSLLSAAGNIPLRQDLAVTGAVDQMGTVLAVGGVNEKIEGFFELCRARGLTGTQGVLIPATNLQSLMVNEEVLEAVRDGLFHIYAMRTVDDGLGLLAGMPVEGRREGVFPVETFHARVEARLEELNRLIHADVDDEEPDEAEAEEAEEDLIDPKRRRSLDVRTWRKRHGK